MHESLDAQLAKERGLRLHPLTVKRLDRYLSAALKAHGALDMQLQHDLKIAAHPRCQAGYAVCNCPICSQGADAAVLFPSANGGTEGGSSTAGPVNGIVQPISVCFCSLPSTAKSLHVCAVLPVCH